MIDFTLHGDDHSLFAARKRLPESILVASCRAFPTRPIKIDLPPETDGQSGMIAGWEF